MTTAAAVVAMNTSSIIIIELEGNIPIVELQKSLRTTTVFDKSIMWKWRMQNDH
jgi:hypothetical protein